MNKHPHYAGAVMSVELLASADGIQHTADNRAGVVGLITASHKREDAAVRIHGDIRLNHGAVTDEIQILLELRVVGKVHLKRRGLGLAMVASSRCVCLNPCPIHG